LEDGPRGVYTGAIGWFADNGGAHLNVAIRTATVTDGEARFHVGAGIVADSDPSSEWHETLVKAGALIAALAHG
jgi:para-aminobenzoate synthetase